MNSGAAAGCWVCCLCGEESNPAKDLGPDHPSLLWRSVEVSSPLGGSGANSPPSAFSLVLLIDGNMLRSELESVAESVASSLDDLGAQVGSLCLIVFTGVVTVYRVGVGGIAAGDVFADLAALLATPEHQRQAYVGPAASCRETFLQTLAVLRGARKQVQGTSTASSLARRRRQQAQIERRPRNLSAAVEVALHLARGAKLPARLVVCLTGAPDVGMIGAAPAPAVFGRLSLAARAQGACIDCFNAGLEPFAAPLLLRLVDATGGLVVQQQSFARDEFGATLVKSLAEQRVPRVGAPPCTVEVRTSPNLSVGHLVGPAVLRDGPVVAAEMGRLDPRAALTVYFDATSGDASGEGGSGERANFAYFQLIAKSCIDGMVRRCVTSHRLAVAEGPETYLAALDEEVLAVLLAKRAVLAASRPGLAPSEARAEGSAALATSLRSIAKAQPRGSSTYLLPPGLASLPRPLYFLAMGPLLGEAHKADDDVSCLRALFLRAGLEDALGLMAPAMVAAGPGDPETRPVPADTLALWSQNSIACDQYTRLFVWRGSAASEESEATCLTWLKQRAARRFPVPVVERCAESNSMGRYVVSRLNPTQNDNAEEQVASFPALGNLSREDLEALRRKFLRTDIPSLKQWLRAVVA